MCVIVIIKSYMVCSILMLPYTGMAKFHNISDLDFITFTIINNRLKTEQKIKSLQQHSQLQWTKK